LERFGNRTGAGGSGTDGITTTSTKNIASNAIRLSAVKMILSTERCKNK
jgi:hypothetical protein